MRITRVFTLHPHFVKVKTSMVILIYRAFQYARLQTAVARDLGLPAGRLAGRHTDAAPKHSLCYISSVSK